MKMRAQGNSIRFRLNRPQVAEFASTGHIATSVGFAAGNALLYTLRQSEETSVVVAAFSSGELVVRIPAREVREWASGEAVAIHAYQSIGDGATLEIVVEKDFQCLHKGESHRDPDAYPNPMAPA